MKKLSLMLFLFFCLSSLLFSTFNNNMIFRTNHTALMNSGGICEDPDVIAYFSLDECHSYINTTNADYSEFEPEYIDTTVCGQYDVVGGYLYRNDPTVNVHSCTPGVNGSNAMCVKASDSCDFIPDDDHSIRFDINVQANMEDEVILSGLSFFEQAPVMYDWILGENGINNYPLKYGIRILKNGEEIYLLDEIETERGWNEELFDFTDIPAFTVTDTSVFHFELFPYCLEGIENTEVSVWDVDEIRLLSCCELCPSLGGTITTSSPTTFCVGDGEADLVELELTGSVAEKQIFIVTDANGIIIDRETEFTFNFENTGLGVCYIMNLAYDGQVVGLQNGIHIDDLFGCFDLSNQIEVVRTTAAGGTISTTSETKFCTGDGIDDLVDVEVTGAEGPEQNFIVTDETGVILNVGQPPFNFEGADSGTCFIWHGSSFDPINEDLINTNVTDIMTCFDLSNSIEISRSFVEGGEISTSDTTYVCSGDGMPDLVNVDLVGGAGAHLVYIISSVSDSLVLSTSASSSFDFETAGIGQCLITHGAFADELDIPEVGSKLSDITGCFDLSNSIEINRSSVDGGMISTTDATIICTSDGIADIIDVGLTDEIGDTSVWVITDTVGQVLNLPIAPPFNFEGLPTGTCLIWNLSYNGELSGLGVGLSATEITGCFALSNPIEVVRTYYGGGEITTEDPTSICSGDNVADTVSVNVTNASGPEMVFLVTDTLNNILELNENSVFDFDLAPEGTCYIYNLSFGNAADLPEAGENISDFDFCHGLSNAIEIVRSQVEPATISTSSATDICTSDGLSDLVEVEISGSLASNTAWVITNTDGQILELPAAPPFDFEGAGVGTCLIWHLVYNGDIIGLETGAFANDLEGCFGLSNPIEVIRTHYDGGIINTDDPTSICSVDGVANVVNVNVNDATGTAMVFIVTDTSNNILELNDTGVFDFSNAPEGTCYIYHLSVGNETDLPQAGMNINDFDFCYGISNAIEIVRSQIEAAEISTSSALELCVGDGFSDLVDVEISGFVATNSAWLITDENGQILNIPLGPPFDFDTAGSGTCEIWHLSYNGNLLGLEVDGQVSELEGCYALSNSITVVREEVVGGVISTTDPTSICVDGTGDGLINVTLSGNLGDISAWIITDIDGIILDVPAAPPFDFSNSASGQCLIWHASYMDANTVIEIGSDVELLDDCFDFSNPILVIRSNVSAASISTTDETNVCVGDGLADLVSVDISGGDFAEGIYIVTDTTGVIIDTSSVAVFDFESADAGTCLIWHLAYNGSILGVEPGFNVSIIAGCYVLSNSIEINRTSVSGGVISTNSNTFVCTGDGIADIVTVNFTEPATGDSSVFLLTDLDANLLGVQTDNVFDFEFAGAGTCLIWHLSYNGDLDINNLPNATELDGCVALSNPISVERMEIEAASISTTDETEICIGDDIPDIIEVDKTGSIGPNEVWVVTDTLGNVLNLNQDPIFEFTNADPGVCLIWHLNYNNGLTGLSLDTNVSGLEGCYAFSNPIEVLRSDLEGGFIFANGSTNICLSDPDNAPLNVSVIDNMGANTAWIITDESGVILELPMAPPFDFSSAPAGTCLIYHASYSGELQGAVLGNNISELQGCVSLSNSIEVIRTFAAGGKVSAIGEETDLSICVGDMIPDTIVFLATEAMGPKYQFVVTDDSDRILALPDTNFVDFESNSIGICRVYGVAYSGVRTMLPGQNIVDSDLSSGCFDLSETYIRVQRLEEGDACAGFTSMLMGDIEFKLFPNPATDQLFVDIERLPYPMGEITVFDIFGREVQSQSIDMTNPNHIPINIAELPKGVYQVQIYSIGVYKHKQFVIRR